MKNIKNLKIKIFSDGADLNEMLDMNKKDFIHGMTTNPSLMKKAGIKDYKKFAKDVLNEIKIKPISFEVFSDDFSEMEKQALDIASWGENVYVKIPITNTKRESSIPLIEKLAKKNIKLNITAVFTLKQIIDIKKNINKTTPVIISIFCGRIADLGINPEPLVAKTKVMFKNYKNVKILWASVREVYNFYQAKKINCDIITVPPNLIKKIRSKKITKFYKKN